MPSLEDDQAETLNIDVAKLRDIVLKAHEFEQEEIPDDPDPGEAPESDIDRETLLDAGEDPTEAELKSLIDDLNDDEIVDLLALVWVGRGDFGRAEWAEARNMARDRRPHQSSRYLMGMPLFGAYIEEGLASLGHPPDGLEEI